MQNLPDQTAELTGSQRALRFEEIARRMRASSAEAPLPSAKPGEPGRSGAGKSGSGKSGAGRGPARGRKREWTALVVMLVLWTVVGGSVALALWLVSRRRARARRAAQVRAVEQAALCRAVPANQTIFVSVVSYRDPECAQTVADLFTTAFCPHRVFVGVFQQNNEQRDVDLLRALSALVARGAMPDFKDHVRIVRASHLAARGPVVARAVVERQLYAGEMFYMVVDSHTTFIRHWDAKCVDMLNRCAKPERAVLTTYAAGFQRAQRERHRGESAGAPSPFLRFRAFHSENHMALIESVSCQRVPTGAPPPTAFWSGNFSFSYATRLQEVPCDPHLEYVFFGEEISMAARLWTAGWDLYVPSFNVAFHIWSRAYRPTFWELMGTDSADSRGALRERRAARSYARLRALFRGESLAAHAHPPDELCAALPPLLSAGDSADPRYALGTVRSLRDYAAYSGVDLVACKATVHARLGLTANASSDEILVKYGSYADMQNVYNQFLRAKEADLVVRLPNLGSGNSDCSHHAASP